MTLQRFGHSAGSRTLHVKEKAETRSEQSKAADPEAVQIVRRVGRERGYATLIVSAILAEDCVGVTKSVALDFQDIHAVFHVAKADAEGGLPRR